MESDSVSSTADYIQGRERGRAPQAQPRGHNQSLLDKLTQEKLDSKTKSNRPNDVSSGQPEHTHTHTDRIGHICRTKVKMAMPVKLNTVLYQVKKNRLISSFFECYPFVSRFG